MNENINFEKLDFATKKGIIEAIIFASDEPLNIDALVKLIISDFSINQNEKKTDDKIDFTEELITGNNELIDEIKNIIITINSELLETNRPYQIIEVAGGYQFSTSKEYGYYIHKLYKARSNRKLSQAALEVLAIIAYKQPITKAEIEQIRGVNSNEIVNSLLEKSLIQIAGRKDVLGHPLMYEVTTEFLKVFGLNSRDDLPKYSEFEELLQSKSNLTEQSFFEMDLTNEQTQLAEENPIQNNNDNDIDIDTISNLP
ncbi:MAG: SMC-Scp complex subunit ScpB [Chloroherpetonaceae bacterium]